MKQLSAMAALVLGSAATAAIGAPTTFTGADAGEGLDFTGTFKYAINASGTTGNLAVGDATFVSQAPSASAINGVKITATHDQPNWAGAPTGASWSNTPADTNLAEILRHISWGEGNDVLLDMDVQTGQDYKLQLLFYEGCCNNRGFDVHAEGNTLQSTFEPGVAQGSAGNSVGSVITYNFTATDNQLNVVLHSIPGRAGDNNPIIDAFTLEAVPEPASLGLMGMASISLLRRRRRRS